MQEASNGIIKLINVFEIPEMKQYAECREVLE